MNQFQVGDVVKLKTGGPKMTVKTANAHSAVIRCIWFDSEDHLHEDTFAPDGLEKV